MTLLSLESLAVALSITYVVFAAIEKKVCWWFALASSLIYIFIFYDVKLYMESMLSVYYALMALYGIFVWGKTDSEKQNSQIISYDFRIHLLILTAIIILSGLSGYILSNNSDAYRPYMDSLTTWSSIFATFLVVKKVLENWIYWILIDSVSIVLYFERELYQTVFLFIVYLGIAFLGLFIWRKNFESQNK
tara:strand:+ start:164 stop:736 length:573 start_codon:yes stop_codon:yes gene_type:complete